MLTAVVVLGVWVAVLLAAGKPVSLSYLYSDYATIAEHVVKQWPLADTRRIHTG